MKINEIFYSLQGEGARAGAPSVFVRLAGCSASEACRLYARVDCDTNYGAYTFMNDEQILAEVLRVAPTCRWLIWTGGEPTDQLTPETLAFFRAHGFAQALETSGFRPVRTDLFDYIACSPKVNEQVLVRHFPAREDGTHVDELRYVLRADGKLPQPKLLAHHYYLSPHSDGMTLNMEGIQRCITLCLQHPGWRLSVQQHKTWNVR